MGFTGDAQKGSSALNFYTRGSLCCGQTRSSCDIARDIVARIYDAAKDKLNGPQ
jgi:hypothetical protein